MQITIIKPTRLIALLAATAALAACGPSSGSGPSSGPSSGSERSTTLSLNYQPTKALNFEWTAVEDVNHYRLLENIDGQSGFRQVGENLANGTLSYTLDIPLYDRINARYLLDACMDAGCTQSNRVQSNEVAVEVEQLVNSVGFFKAFNEDDATVDNSGAKLGNSVALSEDGQTLVAGAFLASIAGKPANSGAVYTYERTAAGEWRTGQRLTAPNAETDNQFGFTVSLSADGLTLAVSAPGENNGAQNVVLDLTENDGPIQDSGEEAIGSGAVYLFTRASRNDDFTATTYIKAVNAGEGDSLGFLGLSLSADGSRLAVGAPFEDSDSPGVQTDFGANFSDNNNLDLNQGDIGAAGAVYLYSRGDDNKWQPQAYIKANNPEQGDLFGFSVSLSAGGNILAVGAAGENNLTGAVHLFEYDTVSNWQPTESVLATQGDAEDRFGGIVQLSADGLTLAVGAYGESSSSTVITQGTEDTSVFEDNDASTSGAAYIFTRSSLAGSWQQQAFIKAPNAEAGDAFGLSVSLSADGNRLAVSARDERSRAVGLNGDQSDNDLKKAGAVYLYTRQDELWQPPVYIKAARRSDESLDAKGDNIDSYAAGFGGFPSNILSLNGDGKTLAVGAPGDLTPSAGVSGNSPDSEGAVYLY